MSAEHYPTIAHVRQCLHEENGRLFWLRRPRDHFATDKAFITWNGRWSGKEAGYLAKSIKGYGRRWIVAIDSKKFYRYRVVWAIIKGEWPERIDHENRNSLDDRIDNLRIATRSQNLANTGCRSDNSTGYKGVGWNPRVGRYYARIRVKGRRIPLGWFDDPAAAHAAYCEAARQHYGQFAGS